MSATETKSNGSRSRRKQESNGGDQERKEGVRKEGLATSVFCHPGFKEITEFGN